MEHDPPTKWKEEKSQSFKTKVGLIMVPIFTLVYFIFIILAVTNPKAMANDFGSFNVAIAYGFGIIILAVIMALIYNIICSRKEKGDEETVKPKGGAK